MFVFFLPHLLPLLNFDFKMGVGGTNINHQSKYVPTVQIPFSISMELINFCFFLLIKCLEGRCNSILQPAKTSAHVMNVSKDNVYLCSRSASSQKKFTHIFIQRWSYSKNITKINFSTLRND